MIELDADAIIAKIKEKTLLPDETIQAKIDEKMQQLSGLISKEGAAHIIANEYGVQVFDLAASQIFKVKNLKANLRNIEISGNATRVFELREFKKEDRTGKVASFIMQDDTGSCRVTLWGSKADKIKEVKEGSIVKIKNAYVKENNNSFEVHLNDKSEIQIEEGQIVVSEKKTNRRPIKELQENELNVEIVGHVLQFFEPRFFDLCPQCNKKVHARDNLFYCDTHQSVAPRHSYVLNISVDDGTDIIRVVCFQNQAEKLLHKTEDVVSSARQDAQKMDALKGDLLGKMVRIQGRVQKNQMFERIELIAQNVSDEIDVDKEISMVKEKIASLG